MALSSAVAFGAVFAGVSLVLSACFAGTLIVSGPALHRMGPWVERRAAAVAIVLPPLLGLAVVAVLAIDAALMLRTGTDHCLDHAHHLHICLRHGIAWSSRPLVFWPVLSLATVILLRTSLSVRAHWRAQRAASRLRAVGTPIDHPGCYLVPSGERFAFTVGIVEPTVVLSSAAWEALNADEREAVLAHELAHVHHGDVRLRAALGLAAALGAPFLIKRVLRTWEQAAERICDRRAAAAVGHPSTVASALLALMQSTPPGLAPAGVFFAAASRVTERVESILREEPGGEEPSQRLLASAAVVSAAFAVACGVLSGPLHHALETILG